MLLLITFAIIGIKFTLSETMPKKQVVTTLDSYINNSLVFLATVGFYHMVNGYLSTQVRCCCCCCCCCVVGVGVVVVVVVVVACDIMIMIATMMMTMQ